MNKLKTLAVVAVTGICALGLAACGKEHSHTYSDEWKYDKTEHWHEATCEHTGEVSGKEEHTLEDGKCTVCGYELSATVTEDEWKQALDFLVTQEQLFDSKATVSDVSFRCYMSYNEVRKGEKSSANYETVFDMQTGTHYKRVDNNKEYIWEEDGAYYYYGGYSEGYVKFKIEQSQVNESLKSNNFVGCCGEQISYHNVKDKYSRFTYDEEEKTYSATFYTSNGTAEITLAFLGGKLVRASITENEDIKNARFELTYEYDIELEIPQEVLGAALKAPQETEMPEG